MDAKPRLFHQVRIRLRTLHYSYRTEQQYLDVTGSCGAGAVRSPLD